MNDTINNSDVTAPIADEKAELIKKVEALTKVVEELTKKQEIANSVPAKREEDSEFIKKKRVEEKEKIEIDKQKQYVARLSNYERVKNIMLVDDPEYKETFKNLETNDDGSEKNILSIEPEALLHFCKTYFDKDSDVLKYRTEDELTLCEKVLETELYDSFKIPYKELKMVQKIVDLIRKDNEEKNIIHEKNSIFNNGVVQQTKITPRKIMDDLMFCKGGDVKKAIEDAKKQMDLCFQKRTKKLINKR